MKFQKSVLALTLGATLTGCSMTGGLSDNQRTAIGAGVGAVLGGVVGHQVNDKNGRYVGAVLGALAGGAIGRYMDNQQQRLEKALASSGITVTRLNESTIKLNLPNSITFAKNKADLSTSVMPSLNQVAAIFNEYNKTAIHVLGFADSDGEERYNLELSQRRAQAASNYLASQGVVSGRIVAQGYGESHPVASNATVSGKAQNRRVEIYVRAIEQGSEQSAYTPIY